MEYVAKGGVVADLVEAWNAPWAMVPLNPNELRREPLKFVVRGTTSTGIWNGFDDTIDVKCAFSLRENEMTTYANTRPSPRSGALTAKEKPTSAPATSDARPAAAAAGSKWPTFDFSDVHWIATSS